ncbi:hypothetical protein HDV05_006990 [Chytridiales sp. JEL 0842]|nr:hypothetical protein HDV05_006990 [Chytridiales sp. JEL 0842]
MASRSSGTWTRLLASFEDGWTKVRGIVCPVEEEEEGIRDAAAKLLAKDVAPRDAGLDLRRDSRSESADAMADALFLDDDVEAEEGDDRGGSDAVDVI